MTKYKAKPVVKTFADGSSIRFDSLAEAAFYDKMVALDKTFVFHPCHYFAIEGGTYRPDYHVWDITGTSDDEHYIEVKGVETPMWRRTRKQLKERYPNLRLLIVYGRADKRRGFVTEREEWLNEPQST
jgi:hypothetical protein